MKEEGRQKLLMANGRGKSEKLYDNDRGKTKFFLSDGQQDKGIIYQKQEN